MATASRPIDLVIVGGTGDLAMRMLYPSLYWLDAEERLDPGLCIHAGARSDLELDAFLEKVHAAVTAHLDGAEPDRAAWQRHRARYRYHRLDAADGRSFAALAQALRLADGGEVVYYLATAPKFYGDICAHLAAAGLTG